MKKIFGSLILGVLLYTGLFTRSAEKPGLSILRLAIGAAEKSASPISSNAATRPTAPVSIDEVLRAYNILQSPEAIWSFYAEATRLTSRPLGIDRALPPFFERWVTVVMAGNLYRRYTTDPQRLREQYDQSDGNASYHAVIEKGKLTGPVNLMTDADARAVDARIITFGLVPILKLLLDPSTEVVYVGRTVCGQDKFEVKTTTRSWILYTDASHLIRRIEIRDWFIEYAGYRSVDGIQLPFIQRVFNGGQLVQELHFTRITLNPKLPADYFSRAALSQEIAH
jgi:hypothetical protein